MLQGDDDALARVAEDSRFLMMVPFHGESRPRSRAWVAALIMPAPVAAATVNVPLEIAGLGGAIAMVLTGCLTLRQAYTAVLVVYGRGGYHFGDFARVGAPLTVIIALTTAFMASWLW